MGVCENYKKKKIRYVNTDNYEDKNYSQFISSENNSYSQDKIQQKVNIIKLNKNKKIKKQDEYKAREYKRSYEEEKNLYDQPKSATDEQMKKILKLMEKSVCKIICKEHSGTGFFCYLNFPEKSDLLLVLFTNYHILREEDILPKKIINISLNTDKISYKIVINENTKTYIDERNDTTIIEINDKNIIKNVKFLYIEEKVYNFNDKQIYKYIKKQYFYFNILMEKNVKIHLV